MTKAWARFATVAWLSSLVSEAGCGRATAAEPAPNDFAPSVVTPSTLPRLRRAWTAQGFTANHWRQRETAPVFDGTLFAVSPAAPKHLVALELATGKERWRVPQAVEPEPQIEFATGMVLRNFPSTARPRPSI